MSSTLIIVNIISPLQFHVKKPSHWLVLDSTSSFFFLFSKSYSISSSPHTTRPFTFNFIRKESFYTKLKYSRVPQFDTSSGAVASLLSGFYGFLVCEKFGFELIDSADFLFMLVYLLALLSVLSCFLKMFDGWFKLYDVFYSWFRSFF